MTRHLPFRTGIFLIVVGLIANLLTLHNHRFLISAQTCYTTAEVQSSSACLYLLNGKVYEKGSRSRPHQGHACGSDVTGILPDSHTSDLISYIDPNFKGQICAAPTATPVPTQPSAPTSTPQPTPTRAAAPALTSTPSVTPKLSSTPTLTLTPTLTATPTPAYPADAFTPLRTRTVTSITPIPTPSPPARPDTLVMASQSVSYISLVVLVLTGGIWTVVRLHQR